MDLLLTDFKIVLKAPLAPIYTNLEGERAQKNAIFWSKFSKKCLNFVNSGSFIVVWEEFKKSIWPT